MFKRSSSTLKISSLQLIAAVILGLGIYNLLAYFWRRVRPKNDEEQSNIKTICTKLFSEELRNKNLKFRNNGNPIENHEVYRCGAHDIYFVVYENNLYGVKNIKSLENENLNKNIKHVPNCLVLRKKYPYAANLV